MHETIDGEVILIQLETGNYYSLGGSGSEIWAQLAHRRSQAETVAFLTARFDAEPVVVERAVERLTAELAAEGLLDSDGAGPPPAAVAPAEGGRISFVEPVLQKYTDMQDFLLVDPIHEVGDSGWPDTPPAA